MFGPDLYSALLGITQRIFGTQDDLDGYTGLKLSYAVSNDRSFILKDGVDIQTADGSSSVVSSNESLGLSLILTLIPFLIVGGLRF